MYICKFCNKECKNGNSLRNHERLCKNNEVCQNTPFQSSEFQKNKKPSNQYVKSKELGLPNPITEITKEKLSIAVLSRSLEFNKKMGAKVSETINSKVQRGEWHTSLAKNMHYQYRGEDFHGTWELSYAKYLDSVGKNWERNKKSFSYIFDGKKRRYTPDFYLPDEGVYVEIKGFTTDKDLAKWAQFPERLTVLTKTELIEMKII